MSLKAQNMGGNREMDVPAITTHMARLVGLTDIGHQPGFEYQGKEIPSSWKIEFTYELVNSLTEEGMPHWVSEDVKVNDFENTKTGIISTMMHRVRILDPDNESVNGKSLTALLTKPCMITLSATEGGYPKIKGQSAVGGIPLGMEVPELRNDTFSFDMDKPDMELWATFSDFKKDKCLRAISFEGSVLNKELSLSEVMY